MLLEQCNHFVSQHIVVDNVCDDALPEIGRTLAVLSHI